MKTKFLESSEFYNARFKNFSTLLLIPCVLLLCLGIIFSLFGYKQIVVKGSGTVEPISKVATIQTTVAGKIIEKNLSEGKSVDKGDVLLKLNDVKLSQKIETLQKKKNLLVKRQQDVQTLQNGIAESKDTFLENNKSDYHDRLLGYLAQKNIYQIEFEMSRAKIQNRQEKNRQLTIIVNEQIQRNTRQLKEYMDIYQAIKSGKNYPSSDLGNLYREKLARAEPEIREDMKLELLSEVEKQIDTFNGQLEELKVQQIQQDNDNSLEAEKKNYENKLVIFRLNQLESTKQILEKITQELLDLNEELQNLQAQLKEYTIKAPIAGVIHMGEQSDEVNYLSGQTQVAQIYPKINTLTRVRVKTYINTDDIASLTKGQKLRFKIERNLPRPIILFGKVTNISVAPSEVNKNSYYAVEAQVDVPQTKRKYLKYGMPGEVSIITGQKTYWNYFKEKIFDK
ncbi:bacteriocin secretion accessory protein [Ligilactobacillus faecis]|uniref:bacteriocin secretion accessory protein n=1 Tax=Ligilactobacillus faecis TaxID=762833 RepID=UPI002469C3EE|nr:bacteriocin secretion accessory protein [Ligilactobacillus faecis]WGN88848.1 bacteriocin secretion accessory protein [Ligilactobacillus faecis]